jgi:Tol biopolymer transport system component
MQKVREHVSGRPSFSPDGSEYVFLRRNPESEQIVRAGAGGVERVIGERRFPKSFNDPVWSPDGTTIAVGGQEVAGGIHGHVVALPADGGGERVFASNPTWTSVGEMSWLPDGSGVVAEVEQNYLFNHVWEVAYPGGDNHRVTTDLNSYHGVEITGDGNTIVTQQMLRVSNLWTVVDGEHRQLTSVGRGSAADNVKVLPDGRFVYHADQGGRLSIWIRDADGKNARRLASEGANAVPCPSPDGTEIAFVSDRAGDLDIWKMPVSGGAATRLTDVNFAVDPVWIGTEIVFLGGDVQSGTTVVYKIPDAGGEPEQITSFNSWNPAGSPDGTRLMYNIYNTEEDHAEIEIMVLATGEVENAIYLRDWEEIAWSPDGTAVHYSKHVDGQDNIYSHPISAGDDTSGDVKITDFDDRIDILSLDWSDEGTTLALTRGKTSRDVVLIKGFR